MARKQRVKPEVEVTWKHEDWKDNVPVGPGKVLEDGRLVESLGYVDQEQAVAHAESIKATFRET